MYSKLPVVPTSTDGSSDGLCLDVCVHAGMRTLPKQRELKSCHTNQLQLQPAIGGYGQKRALHCGELLSA